MPPSSPSSSPPSSPPSSHHQFHHQFHLDAPRIAFYRNGSRLNSHNGPAFLDFLHGWSISHHYTDPDTQVLMWCTQTALAPVYKRKLLDIVQAHTHTTMSYVSPSTPSHHPHLVDDGMQQITLDDQSGLIHIRKPFRVIGDPPPILHGSHATHATRAHNHPNHPIPHPPDFVIIARLELLVTLSSQCPPHEQWVDVPIQPMDVLSAAGKP